MDWLAPLPYTTAALPGVGGTLKHIPEDFEVEEIPAYEPTGVGDHLYLWIEKRQLAASALVAHVARALNISKHDIGTAGLKDTFAVTRQYLSVPAEAAPWLKAVDSERVKVLASRRHGNKLRTGHLRGNRFRVVIRGVGAADAVARAQMIAQRLQTDGMANYYGDQRFGRDGETLTTGLQLLRGTRLRMSGMVRRLAISAVQSGLFNRYLAARLDDGLLYTVLPGEVLQVCASGGPFVTDDPAREQQRFLQREVVPAGPMPGPKMRQAKGVALERETALWETAGIGPNDFASLGKLALGTRRANLVWPEALTVEAVAEGLCLRFTLPAGSYATCLLREVLKGDASQGAL